MCYFSVHREVHFLKICREHFIVDLRNLLNGPAIAEHPASQPQTAHQTIDYYFLRNSWTTGGHQASKPRDAYQTRGFTYTVKTTQTVKYLLIPV